MSTRPAAGARRRVSLARPERPVVLAAAGAAFVGLVAIWIGMRLRVVVLDEAVYKLAAAQYVDRFPYELIDDQISRGAARFYAFLLMPLSLVFEADVAVRAGRALNALLWAGTAVPVYFLAKRVVASTPLAALAAVGSVAVPWLTLATILFSEPTAYLLFALLLLAMVRALERPGLRADALVAGLLVVLVLTRVQFVVLVPVWVGVVVWAEWGSRRDWRGVVRRRPVIAAGFALLVLAALVIVASGSVDRVLESLGGPYEKLRDRETLQGDFGLATLFEVEMLALGVGIVPAILAAAWAPRALAGRFGVDARRLAVVGVAAIAAVFAGTLFAQGGWLDSRSEERYFIYAVPLLWVFAVAAIERGLMTARLLVGGGLVLAVIATLVPVPVGESGEQIFLGPVSRIVVHVAPQLQDAAEAVTGLERVAGTRDMTALLILAVAGLAALGARRGRIGWALAPAFALQLVLCGYAVWAIDQGLGGSEKLVGGPPFAELSWVDRATDEGVALIQEDGGSERSLVFWNDVVLDAYRPESVTVGDLLYPVNSLRARPAVVSDDLTLDVPPARALTVGLADSAQLQLAGEVVARSPDRRYVVQRPGPEPRAVWATRGLPAGNHVEGPVELFAQPGTKVTIHVVPSAFGADTDFEVGLGGGTLAYDSGTSARAKLFFDLCGANGPVTGRIEPVNFADRDGAPPSAGHIERVTVEPC